MYVTLTMGICHLSRKHAFLSDLAIIYSWKVYFFTIFEPKFIQKKRKIMANEEVKSKLKSFFMSDLGVDGDVLQYDTALFGDEIGLDSVDSLEIISFVDSTFGVSMTGVAKENFQSIDTIAAYIEAPKA